MFLGSFFECNYFFRPLLIQFFSFHTFSNALIVYILSFLIYLNRSLNIEKNKYIFDLSEKVSRESLIKIDYSI